MGPLHVTCASSYTGPKIIRILTSVQGSNTKCPKWTQQEWNGFGSYTASLLLHSVGYKAISEEEEDTDLTSPWRSTKTDCTGAHGVGDDAIFGKYICYIQFFILEP